MGTINYKSSDYITLGIKPYSVDDFLNDEYFREEAEEIIRSSGIKNINSRIEEELISYAQDYIYDLYEADEENINLILNQHNFYYFTVKIEPGYYEGFALNIENNFPSYFEDWQEKRDAQKEITQLKNMLVECVNTGLSQCWPGWCTKYFNREETLKAINKAVKAMRVEASVIPTFNQCK